MERREYAPQTPTHTVDYLRKWFEPRNISSLSSVIVRVSVVLQRTVGDSD